MLKILRDGLDGLSQRRRGKPPKDEGGQPLEALLTQAVHRFYIAESHHSESEFEQLFLPPIRWYRAQLRKRMDHQAEIGHTEELIQALTDAVMRRRNVRLPTGRRDVDYRRVYAVYTYALVTAMIVDAYIQLTQSDERPDDVLSDMLPPEGLELLHRRASVWEDWLGYFERAERGGLYAVATDRWNRRDHQGSLSRSAKKPSAKVEATMVDRAKAVIDKPETDNTVESANSLVGDQVLIALKQCLADRTLACNAPDAYVNADRHGRVHLRSPEVFGELARLKGWSETPQRLKNRFLRLKVHQVSPSGNSQFYGRSKRGKAKWRAGHVLKDGSLIWPEATITGTFRIDCPLAG